MYFPARRALGMLRQTGIKLGGREFPVAVALGYHAQQCDQRWWGVRIGPWRLAYRTRGDASPGIMTRGDAGMWWPWQTHRLCSGLWL